ncbi:MAG: hypothetical protein PHX05_00115 [Acidobacteriota bacterium]|nr:hypothetical protein [Acidobacteriota bacterium]
MNAFVINLENQLAPTANSVTAEELSVGASVVTPEAQNALTSHVWVSVKTKSVYVTFDGTDPVDASAGILLAAGYNGIWSKRLINAARFIQGDGAAVVRIEPLSD